AADERSAHAFGAHRDAVGNGDGVEFERSAARGAHPVLDVLGKVAQVVVTGADLNPGIRDADQRLCEVRVGQATGAEHGARTGAVWPFDECSAAQLSVSVRHFVAPLLRLENKMARKQPGPSSGG